MNIVKHHTIKEIVEKQFYRFTEPKLRELIQEHGVYKKAKAGDVLMDIGEFIKSIPLISKGVIKIIREDENGNEIFLYYLRSGETCAMSLTCCMASQRSQIKAVAVEDTEMIKLPSHYMDSWLEQFPSWKSFVMEVYQKRFQELLQTIDSIAFLKMDERLLKYIRDRAKTTNSKIIKATHQDIAEKLNSTRVVISRLLKQMEKEGLIKMGRNSIELL